VSLGTHLIHSVVYHPQTNGQMERVNQFLEDMLRACVIEYQGSWDKNLPLGRVLVQQQLPGESKNGTI
jgi:hypothetical protein